MSNQQVALFSQGGGAVALSNKFQAMVAAGAGMDLGEGIRNSYGILGIKGGKWRVKYKSQETILSMQHPQDPSQFIPVSFVDVVIVKANGFLNKQYYQGNYVEGSNSPPDCFSLNGKTPSPQVQKPQHTNCALCPQNQFGSKIGDDGKKQKACRDTKKLAVVPLADIRNSTMGGAMLFRVPPSSLKDLSTMSDALKARGYPYNSVAVRLGFDTSVSHPKPTFQALRPLSDPEADLVLEMFSSDSVEAVLADDSDIVAPVGEAPIPASAQFLQPGPVAAPAGAPVNTHGWQPGQPLPRIDPTQVPPVAAQAAQPRPQAPAMMLNTPEGQPLAPPPGVVFQPAQPAPQLAPAPIAEVQVDQVLSAPAGFNPFAAAGQVQESAPVNPQPPKTRRAPVQAVSAPAAAPAPTAEIAPASVGQLDAEIGDLLAGLGEFMGGK
jgi:hypothetical protein